MGDQRWPARTPVRSRSADPRAQDPLPQGLLRPLEALDLREHLRRVVFDARLFSRENRRLSPGARANPSRGSEAGGGGAAGEGVRDGAADLHAEGTLAVAGQRGEHAWQGGEDGAGREKSDCAQMFTV